jgi:hypothetical protein
MQGRAYMPIEIVRELKLDRRSSRLQQQTLVKKDEKYFVVSSSLVPFTGLETLVFPANAMGEITHFLAVAGGRGMTHLEAIVDLEKAG